MNWAEHFQAVSRGASTATFGSLDHAPPIGDFRAPYEEPDPRIFLLNEAAVPSRTSYDVFGLDLEGDLHIFGRSVPKKTALIVAAVLAVVGIGASSMHSAPVLAA
jgi:hypothetical protein